MRRTELSLLLLWHCVVVVAQGMLDYLATVSPFSTILVIFFCIFPPIFYDRIFLPCWQVRGPHPLPARIVLPCWQVTPTPPPSGRITRPRP